MYTLVFILRNFAAILLYCIKIDDILDKPKYGNELKSAKIIFSLLEKKYPKESDESKVGNNFFQKVNQKIFQYLIFSGFCRK